MPRTGSAQGARGPWDQAVDEIWKTEIKTYQNTVEEKRHVRKLQADRAVEEKLVRDMLKKPTPDCEALINRGAKLEDEGHLSEAVAAYQRALACEMDNYELRAYINDLVLRINKQQVAAKAKQRASDLEDEWNSGPAPQRVVVATKPVGPMMPMNPEAYRSELAAQAMAAKKRMKEARREEERLEQKQVALAAAMKALELHKERVEGGNQRLNYQNALVEDQKARVEDRMRKYHLEWEELNEAAKNPAGGPLGGVDEYARRRQQVQDAHAHRMLQRNAWEDPADPWVTYHLAHGHQLENVQGGARQPLVYPQDARGAAAKQWRPDARQQPWVPQQLGPGGLQRRPASADSARAGERLQNNKRNFDRQVTSARLHSPRPQAPFARPGVDRSKPPKDMRVVKAKQQAYLDKHKKAEPPVQKSMVPMRVRKEALRHPATPVLAEGLNYG